MQVVARPERVGGGRGVVCKKTKQKTKIPSHRFWRQRSLVFLECFMGPRHSHSLPNMSQGAVYSCCLDWMGPRASATTSNDKKEEKTPPTSEMSAPAPLRPPRTRPPAPQVVQVSCLHCLRQSLTFDHPRSRGTVAFLVQYPCARMWVALTTAERTRGDDTAAEQISAT